MTNLFIRDLDPILHARLTARAAAHHRSPEAEARLLLQASLAAPTPSASSENLVGLARQLFGPAHGIDLMLPARTAMADRPPPSFDPDEG